MRQAIVPVTLALAGAIVAVASGGSTAGTAVAIALVGLACVVAVSLVFLAVGRSEDAARGEGREPPPSEPDPHHNEGSNGRTVSPARARRRPLPPRRPD